MPMVVWFFFSTILILSLLFWDQRRTDKKRLILLRRIAKQFGIDELPSSRDWLSSGTNVVGRWNAMKVSLALSSTSNGIEALLELNASSSTHLRIRRARHFFNRDLMELITRNSEPRLKFLTSSNHGFEIFSDDPSNITWIIDKNGIKSRLELCIVAQDDLLEIEKNRILVKASSEKFFGSIDWDEIEEKLIQMWFLATTIAASLSMNTKIDFNLLKCPFCRDKLDEDSKVVRCNSCHTLFHESCWQENGQCAIFRCYGSTTETIENKSSHQ